MFPGSSLFLNYCFKLRLRNRDIKIFIRSYIGDHSHFVLAKMGATYAMDDPDDKTGAEMIPIVRGSVSIAPADVS